MIAMAANQQGSPSIASVTQAHSGKFSSRTSLLKRTLLTTWLIIFLMFRPCIYGEYYGGILLLIFLTTVTLLISLINGRSLPISQIGNIAKSQFGLILLFCIYLCLQAFFLSDAFNMAIRNIGTILIVSLCVLVACRRNDLHYLLAKYVVFHFVISISIVISAFLLVFVHFDYSKLILFSFQWFDNVVSVIFPFSLTFASRSLDQVYTRLSDAEIKPFIGIYTEPGAAQYMFLTAFFLTFYLRIKAVNFIRSVLLISVLFMLSLSGYINIIVGMFLFWGLSLFRIKPYKAIAYCTVFLLILSVLYFQYDFDLGVAKKLESASGISRQEVMNLGFTKFVQKPVFGYGFFYGAFAGMGIDDIRQASFVGIWSFLYMIGFVGIIMYLLIWYQGLFSLGRPSTFPICFPVLFTAYTAQPSLIYPIVWFLVLIDKRGLRLKARKHKVRRLQSLPASQARRAAPAAALEHRPVQTLSE